MLRASSSIGIYVVQVPVGGVGDDGREKGRCRGAARRGEGPVLRGGRRGAPGGWEIETWSETRFLGRGSPPSYPNVHAMDTVLSAFVGDGTVRSGRRGVGWSVAGRACRCVR